MTSAVAVFMGLQYAGRVPAMLNYTVGAAGMTSACETAEIRTVLTSRRFIEAAKLQEAADLLAARVRVVYLEDLAANVSTLDRLTALALSFVAGPAYARSVRRRDPDAAAVVLFTSGSEGSPKGVVLSHANLLANREQLAARVDFSA